MICYGLFFDEIDEEMSDRLSAIIDPHATELNWYFPYYTDQAESCCVIGVQLVKPAEHYTLPMIFDPTSFVVSDEVKSQLQWVLKHMDDESRAYLKTPEPCFFSWCSNND